MYCSKYLVTPLIKASADIHIMIFEKGTSMNPPTLTIKSAASTAIPVLEKKDMMPARVAVTRSRV